MTRPVFRKDLSPAQVAEILGYANVDEFLARKEEYERLGLLADRLTGRYDPDGFERWRRLRMGHLYPELSAPKTAADAGNVFTRRLRGG